MSREGTQGNWAPRNTFSAKECGVVVVEKLSVVPLSRVVRQGFLKCTISREGAQGNWAPWNAVSVEQCGVVVELLTLPSLAVIRIIEYL